MIAHHPVPLLPEYKDEENEKISDGYFVQLLELSRCFGYSKLYSCKYKF